MNTSSPSFALSGSKTEGEQRLEFADTIIEQQQVRIDQLEAKLKDTKGENEAIKLLAKELSTHVGRGYDAKHDDEHTDGALADMAAIYCCTHRTDEMRELNLRRLIWGTEPSHIYENGIRSYNDWFTEQPDRVTELVKAGALIVAEILRLLRQKGKQ